MAEFEGFPREGFKFLGELAANNTRDWFQDNKKTYEAHVKAPAAVLNDALMHALAKECGCPMKGKIFRINRDLRFSKDKTPYNTHVRMAFWPDSQTFANRKSQPPSFYLSLEADHIVLGAGIMAFDKQELVRYRNAVAGSNGEDLHQIADDLTANGFALSEPDLARVPSGFAADHEMADFLRRKGLAAWTTINDVALATGPGAAGRLIEGWKPAMPLWRWLMDLQED